MGTIERRLWQAVEIIVALAIAVGICLVVALMVSGSSLAESLVTLKELV